MSDRLGQRFHIVLPCSLGGLGQMNLEANKSIIHYFTVSNASECLLLPYRIDPLSNFSYRFAYLFLTLHRNIKRQAWVFRGNRLYHRCHQHRLLSLGPSLRADGDGKIPRFWADDKAQVSMQPSASEEAKEGVKALKTISFTHLNSFWSGTGLLTNGQHCVQQALDSIGCLLHVWQPLGCFCSPKSPRGFAGSGRLIEPGPLSIPVTLLSCLTLDRQPKGRSCKAAKQWATPTGDGFHEWLPNKEISPSLLCYMHCKQASALTSSVQFFNLYQVFKDLFDRGAKMLWNGIALLSLSPKACQILIQLAPDENIQRHLQWSNMSQCCGCVLGKEPDPRNFLCTLVHLADTLQSRNLPRRRGGNAPASSRSPQHHWHGWWASGQS